MTATMNGNGTVATPATAWASPAREPVRLPSGNTAVLRDKMPVYLMLRTGQLSTELFVGLQQFQKGQLQDIDLAAELIDIAVCSLFVEPLITADTDDAGMPVRDPENGMLHITDLDDADVDFAITRAFGGTPDESFPGVGDGTGSGVGGGDVREPAKRDAGPPKRKPSSARGRPAAS